MLVYIIHIRKTSIYILTENNIQWSIWLGPLYLYNVHTNFDIDVICFQLGNGQFQLLMQFCNLFYIRTTTTTYFLRLLLFSKTSNFPQLTIEKGMLYVQYTSHTGQHKQLGLNKSQGCLKNPNEKHLARILFD